ncbi:hypothetical protein VOLCADRAFT_96791 [Volvox carteri f. nagariensis]|uniref:Uncharacterized protein n=1 Tax=Volvox carteri f. nagariensis TaxID=3068 RepID=D8UB25_VOLCA|nr:uncharacterized protein VOLCADRAFT_96791 [Volvox carteri f. nagariensis]EFJ43036.1 hypothetical protein VOLCADRAFT_96791 [Volvox carteri f. nagariensis]|eukprot:XP_002955835.1 hypothetical protein VOLCADRAFT_96791 [Volvox carteri f. nagariensis]
MARHLGFTTIWCSNFKTPLPPSRLFSYASVYASALDFFLPRRGLSTLRFRKASRPISARHMRAPCTSRRRKAYAAVPVSGSSCGRSSGCVLGDLTATRRCMFQDLTFWSM